MKTQSMRFALIVLVSTLAGSSSGEEWGTLRGRFVVQGEAPKPAPLIVKGDPVCKLAKPMDERVLVGKEGGLRNAVVYVRPPRGKSLQVHPDYAGAVDEPVEFSNKQCCFTPRVCLALTGQMVVVKNEDETAHNTKFEFLKNETVNNVIPANEQFTTSFALAEILPLPVSCNMHPFMRGYVLVRDDPYMAVTDEEGGFEIRNLPAGEHEFQLWHESGYLKNVAFDGGSADRRGRIRLTIPADGELDLGEVKVPVELLTR